MISIAIAESACSQMHQNWRTQEGLIGKLDGFFDMPSHSLRHSLSRDQDGASDVLVCPTK